MLVRNLHTDDREGRLRGFVRGRGGGVASGVAGVF